ncbi:hypothetical protein D9757_001057 [Collybiopsis confluens]|uniref:Carbohydrate-binding module family 50 protein n=1 Tax=Collybiopsis confluens TaxID=2823264 RepID=A0A8H5I039_9AGAR|nr:hypothetical protein D9757_001057 [Collybiopsis confluens]
MGRWTQFSEDACRLPEGFQRIAYDADTQRYTFKDRQGTLYHSAPGETYGKLMPIPNAKAESWRYDDAPKLPRLSKKSKKSPPASFHDFLPAEAITSASPTSPTSSEEHISYSPRARFVDAARRTTAPKMQGVVDNLRRSVTSARRQVRVTAHESDQVGLLRSRSVMSQSSMTSSRSGTTLVSLAEETRAK